MKPESTRAHSPHLVYCDDQEYDISDFIQSHPGGAHVLANTIGIDIKPLIKSYHPNDEKVFAILNKYATGNQNVDKTKILMRTEYDYTLYDKLKSEVYKFTAKNLTTTKWSNRYMRSNILKGILYLITIYSYFVFPSIFTSILFGLMGIGYTGLLHHEGSHNEASKKPVVNFLLRYTILPFASPSMWDADHNIRHHPHTNTDFDNDFASVSHVSIGRFSRKYIYRIWYYLQPVYIILFFSLIVFTKGIIRSITIFLGMEPEITSKTSRIDSVIHFVMFYLFFVRHGCVNGFLYPILALITYSNIFMFFSQVNHINSDNIDNNTDQRDFCKNQIESSTDYRVNPVTRFLCFGLQDQIEHHLFPGISHEHYDLIRPIVVKFCKDNNIRYNIKDSYLETLVGYLNHLTKCSIDDKVQ